MPLFRSRERALEEEQVDLYSRLMHATSQMPLQDCRRQVASVVKGITDECRREQIDYVATDGGTRLFAAVERGIPTYVERVATAIEEGATHSDILAWWNLSYLSRRMMEYSETAMRYAKFLSCKDRGMSEDQAMEAVRLAFPMYGDPKDQTDVQGDDRLLPPELRLRVDSYRNSSSYQTNLLRLERGGFKTFNAFVRSEIRLGRL